MSAETLQFHYGKHHNAYVTRLNQLIEGKPELEKMSLEQLIKTQEGVLFNQAAQVWNHTFFWNCLKPKALGGGGEPSGPVRDAIVKQWGSFDKFKDEFSGKATGHFASGWAWLVVDKQQTLKIVDTHDAGCPLRDGLTPLLTCDVWEHAYYVDYRNDRAKFVQGFWNLVNWDFVNENLAKAKAH